MKKIISSFFIVVFILCMCTSAYTEEGSAECEHEWKDYQIIKAATCSTTGEKVQICTKCFITKRVEIPIDKEAHDWDLGKKTTDASYEAEGVMTYTCNNNSEHTKTEAIPKLKHVDSLSITPKILEMTIGDPAVTLTVSVAPSDAANKAVEWISSNTSVVTINSSGVLVPVSAGTANIRAVAVDGSSVYDISTVTIKNKSADPAPGASDPSSSGGSGTGGPGTGGSGTTPSGPAPVDPAPAPVDPSLPGPPTPPGPYTEYTITYHPGAYGQGTPQAFTMAPGPGWLLGPTFTRPGYAQTGWSWYYDGKEKNADVFSVFAMPPKDIIVYPYWEPVKGPVTLTVGYSGSGAVQVNGRYVYNGEVFTLREGDSLTFGLYPSYGNYVYSVLLGNRYREVNTAYGYTITYDMLQGRNQTLLIRFESVYCRPKTGDDSNIALWAVLGACSVVCLGVLLVAKRKKK